MTKLSEICYINEKDMWITWGGLLQRGSYETLMTPPGMKDYVENKSRLKHGTQVTVSHPRVEERSFSLSIRIRGKSEADYLQKYQSFIDELQSGFLLMRIPALKATYRLLYDSCAKYGNQGSRAGLFSIKFREPNPSERSNG